MLTPNEVLSFQVRRLRHRRNWHLKRMADLAGIKLATYKSLECGQVRFHPEYLLRVQTALQLPIEKIWPFSAPESFDGAQDGIGQAVREARLAWKPDIDWVLRQVADVCGVDLRQITEPRSTSGKVLNARTVAALVVQDTGGLKMCGLAAAVNRDQGTLTRACTEARWLDMEKTRLPVQRIKRRLQERYAAD